MTGSMHAPTTVSNIGVAMFSVSDQDAALAAFIGHVVANGFTDSNGSDIVALESALEAWGKRS